MGSGKKLVSVAIAACAVLLTSQAAHAASKCVGAMAKDGAKVAATKGKDIGACLKSGGGAACINTDSSKVVGAATKVAADYSKNCENPPPAFGVPAVPAGTAAAIAEVAVDNEEQLAFSVFGTDASTSTDKAGAKCQTTVQKTYSKAVDTYNKGFQSCIKSQNDEAGLQSCVMSDPGGKGAAALGKVEAGISKACVDQSVADLFPGTCADAPLALLSECVGIRTRCYTCRMQNAMHGLHANCDQLDDGSENGSCAAGLANTCTFASGSGFPLSTALGPINLAATGSIDIAVGGSSGSNKASCNLRSLSPVNLAGVGFVCVSPATGCSPGSVDCAGGSSKGVSLNAQRTIGSCTDNTTCASACSANCGAGATVIQSACEGFCTGSNPANQACTTDAQCLGNGACAGQDGVPNGNICECQCLLPLPDSTPPGGIRCNLGTSLVVEAAAPCDGNDVIITVGTACFPLTTTNAFGIVNNANAIPGNQLGPFVGSGATNSCSDQNAGDTSGMKLVGSYAFFASTIGDILTGTNLICQ